MEKPTDRHPLGEKAEEMLERIERKKVKEKMKKIGPEELSEEEKEKAKAMLEE